MSREAKLEKLAEKREEVLLGGGKKRIAKQHESGKMTARERLRGIQEGRSAKNFHRDRPSYFLALVYLRPFIDILTQFHESKRLSETSGTIIADYVFLVKRSSAIFIHFFRHVKKS
jgi:hypothetical protein